MTGCETSLRWKQVRLVEELGLTTQARSLEEKTWKTTTAVTIRTTRPSPHACSSLQQPAPVIVHVLALEAIIICNVRH